MRGLSFLVKCYNCEHQNKLPWIKELAGQKRMTRCRKCKHRIKIEYPTLPPVVTREIIRPTKSQYSKGFLELVDEESGRTLKFPIEKKYVKIGRKSSTHTVDIPIISSDKRISRLHFVIKTYHHGLGVKKFTIVPMPNTNGTKLNDRILNLEHEVFLNDGDQIKVGSSNIIFRAEP